LEEQPCLLSFVQQFLCRESISAGACHVVSFKLHNGIKPWQLSLGNVMVIDFVSHRVLLRTVQVVQWHRDGHSNLPQGCGGVHSMLMAGTTCVKGPHVVD